MKMYDNGVYREMTEEEIKAEQPIGTATPTLEERLQALEAAMLAQILGGVSDE